MIGTLGLWKVDLEFSRKSQCCGEAVPSHLLPGQYEDKDTGRLRIKTGGRYLKRKQEGSKTQVPT